MIGKLIRKSLLVLLGAAAASSTAQNIAFPGAEGFGKFTTGGRGGKVYIVSNLEDSGKGSLREAVGAKGPRVVVFAVSGTIHLLSKLNIQKDVTIAGQTAPGDGICIADHPVSLAGDNIIIRFLRFRMGDRYQNKGMVDGAGSDDALGATKRKNIVVDHCSISWSTDEVFSIYGGDSTTISYNMIYEPLNYSYHFETGDTDFEHHGYGGIWGGAHLSAHHNLIAHCNSRNPRFNGTRLGATVEFVDFRNNVIYDWGHNNVYGGENGTYNIVNNYYKYGPSTGKGVRNRIVNPTTEDKNLPAGKFFVKGNFVDGFADVSADNRLGVHLGKNAAADQMPKILVASPFPSEAISEESAETALQQVLRHGGASLPGRDTLDQRILKEVRVRGGRMIDVQGGFPHGTAYEKSKGAWPALKSAAAPKDTDQDGMPDDWEKKNKLNPTDAADAAKFTLAKGYTNIEVYVNSLVKY
jgi:hypothetical protein